MSNQETLGKEDALVKVLFLDIDGVLNGLRSVLAYGKYPLSLEELKTHADPVAVAMIRNLVLKHDISVVLSSAWRLHYDYKDVAEALGFPIIGATPSFAGIRGEEIQHWLDHHLWANYVIVDDNDDMQENQMENFVQTSGEDGLSYRNLLKICSVLGVAPPFGFKAPDRNDILKVTPSTP
jgi:hypothetical protein